MLICAINIISLLGIAEMTATKFSVDLHSHEMSSCTSNSLCKCSKRNFHKKQNINNVSQSAQLTTIYLIFFDCNVNFIALLIFSNINLSILVCLFVLFFLLTRGKTSDVKHRAITQTHFRRYRHYHVRLFFLFFLRCICRCETDSCAVFPHHTKSLLGN